MVILGNQDFFQKPSASLSPVAIPPLFQSDPPSPPSHRHRPPRPTRPDPEPPVSLRRPSPVIFPLPAASNRRKNHGFRPVFERTLASGFSLLRPPIRFCEVIFLSEHGF
ncbi:unnamed protein product [Prunus armeniaca]